MVRFLDEMLRDKAPPYRIEEVPIPAALAAGRQADRRRRHPHRVERILILAVKADGVNGYRFNPGADFELGAGMTLVVLGPLAEVEALRGRAQNGA